MRDFKHKIILEAEKINQLHKNIDKTLKNRGTNRAPWEKACKEFHSYTSELNELVNRVYEESEPKDTDVIEFILSFLEVDPVFFRSGYIKEEMLKKIKRVELTEKQIYRLRNVLYSAVESRGFREFKGYCRLAPIVTNNQLNEWLSKKINSSEGAVKSRAKLMLKQINAQNST